MTRPRPNRRRAAALLLALHVFVLCAHPVVDAVAARSRAGGSELVSAQDANGSAPHGASVCEACRTLRSGAPAFGAVAPWADPVPDLTPVPWIGDVVPALDPCGDCRSRAPPARA